ncbi:glycosyltransferase [soil metagenome]
MRPLALACWAAMAGTAHATLNTRLLRTLPADPPPVPAAVAVLIPARDEADRIGDCLRAVLAQQRVSDLTVLVLDDGSTDGTAAAVRAVAAGDPRLRLLPGAPLPSGWLGKPHACWQLAQASPGAEILIFLDADVRLEPRAVAGSIALLVEGDLDLVSPFPRQVAVGAAERLVQPLLAWSWLTFLPLRLAERSVRPSLTAVIGQLLVVRRTSYDRAGGHRAVRSQVLEDLALARRTPRAAVADGSALASCRMYAGWPEVRAGYRKSLWSAFGSTSGAIAVVAGLGFVYVVPAVAALRGSRLGLAGYLAGVTGRVIAARRTGGRVWPDACWHPVSVACTGWLILSSLWHRRRGRLTWKGRPV